MYFHASDPTRASETCFLQEGVGVQRIMDRAPDRLLARKKKHPVGCSFTWQIRRFQFQIKV